MRTRSVIVASVCSVVVGIGAWAHAESTLREAMLQPSSGSVTWQSQGAGPWQAVSQSTPVKQGDHVRTAANSSAMLRLDDGSQLTLEPSTELSIQTLKRTDAGKLQSNFGLLAGGAGISVKPLQEGSLFQIEAAAATARVPAINVTTEAQLKVGSLEITVTSGRVDIIREGDNALQIHLEGGHHIIVKASPTGDSITVTNAGGIVEVFGANGRRVTLAQNDSVTFQAGAATFIPSQPALGNGVSPDQDRRTETTNTDAPAEQSTFTPPSGG